MKNYNWAVLGTGVIANETAAAMQKNGRNLFAVGNRTHDKAVAFAEKYNVGKVYDSYDEMFTDPDVDIIYITTPHNTHYGFMKKAILYKKHILVEKSITLNSDELNELITLADENNVVIGEAMTVYHMPIYKKLDRRNPEKRHTRQGESYHNEFRQFQGIQYEKPFFQQKPCRRCNA